MQHLAASPVLWVTLGAIGILLMLRATRLGETVSVLGRLFFIAFPVVVAFSAPFAAVLLSDPIPEPLRPALLAALVVVAGWIVTFLFQELGRSQDQTDLMLALRAEIFIIRDQIDPITTRGYLDQVVAQFAQAQQDGVSFRPFVTMPANPTVFEGVAPQITRLPSEVVDDVIQFYSLLSDLKVFATDLRSDAFSSLPPHRAEQAYVDYYETRLVLASIADTALKSLDLAIGLDRRNGMFRNGGSNRAAGRSDQGSGAAVSENRT